MDVSCCSSNSSSCMSDQYAPFSHLNGNDRRCLAVAENEQIKKKRTQNLLGMMSTKTIPDCAILFCFVFFFTSVFALRVLTNHESCDDKTSSYT